jgi:hypothetical protein
MGIPFTVEQFFDLFETYNTAIWPSQIGAYVAGTIAVGLGSRENPSSSRTVSAVLALFWIWMGCFYHLVYFSRINPAAVAFGSFFVLEGLLFLIIGTFRGKISFAFRGERMPVLGLIFIIYAMVVYPILGLGFGHSYPRSPMFGVAPCPTTIFTFGILLWATRPVPAYLLVIPLVWSIIGMGAAVNLDVPQDYGLVVAGVVGTALILLQNRAADPNRSTRSV